jgi:hypothetical protein
MILDLKRNGEEHGVRIQAVHDDMQLWAVVCMARNILS